MDSNGHPIPTHDVPSLLRSLMTNVPGAIYRCALDRAWTMRLIGDEIERIAGYPAADFVDNACRTFSSVIHEDDRARVEQQVKQRTEAGEPFTLEYRIRHRDGGVRWVMERGVLALGERGERWLDGVIFDITERRAAEERARERDAQAVRAAEIEASRARIVAASDEARRRIERDLHDGAQQRLVAAAMTLGQAQQRLNGGDPDLVELVGAAKAELDAGLEELRELARGIHPSVLTDRGLTAALEALAARAPCEVELDTDAAARLAPCAELALYFAAAEALTNVARYSGARRARVRLSTAGREARLEVRDDGRGGADARSGTGLRGLADRLAAIGGQLDVISPAGSGTTLVASVPR